MKALEASKQLAGRDGCLNSCAALLPISAEEYLAERDSAAFRSLLAEVSVPAPADAALWPVCAQNGHLRCGCRLLHARSCPIGGCMLVPAQAFICTLPCALWWVRGQSNTNAAVTPVMKGGKWPTGAHDPAMHAALLFGPPHTGSGQALGGGHCAEFREWSMLGEEIIHISRNGVPLRML